MSIIFILYYYLFNNQHFFDIHVCIFYFVQIKYAVNLINNRFTAFFYFFTIPSINKLIKSSKCASNENSSGFISQLSSMPFK